MTPATSSPGDDARTAATLRLYPEDAGYPVLLVPSGEHGAGKLDLAIRPPRESETPSG
jgi:hypothetical protein